MTKQEMEDMVESWNWNCTIFDIYEEIKHMREGERDKLVNFAFNFFSDKGSKDSLSELAHHFGIHIEQEEEVNA